MAKFCKKWKDGKNWIFAGIERVTKGEGDELLCNAFFVFAVCKANVSLKPLHFILEFILVL